MSKNCNCKKEPEECQLSYKGNECKLYNFELDPTNLAFDKCENFPKLLEKFINCVGLDVFKTIASKAVGGLGDTGLNYPYANNYNGALQLYSNIGNYIFCGQKYVIRCTLIKSDGFVIFDSQEPFSVIASQSQTIVPPKIANHATRMEWQRASETQWGAQRRKSNTIGGGADFQYYASWLAGVNLSNSGDTGNPATSYIIDSCDKRTEVVGLRLAIQVDSCNNFLTLNGGAKQNLPESLLV
jgi:hypothetical protein